MRRLLWIVSGLSACALGMAPARAAEPCPLPPGSDAVEAPCALAAPPCPESESFQPCEV